MLGRFAREEEDAVGGMIAQARLAIQCCQSEGMAVTMNRFNGPPIAGSTPDEESKKT